VKEHATGADLLPKAFVAAGKHAEQLINNTGLLCLARLEGLGEGGEDGAPRLWR